MEYVINTNQLREYAPLLKAGDRVEIIFPEVWHGVQPKEGKIDILYEDEFLLIQFSFQVCEPFAL